VIFDKWGDSITSHAGVGEEAGSASGSFLRPGNDELSGISSVSDRATGSAAQTLPITCPALGWGLTDHS
jgi:hypothetical protein